MKTNFDATQLKNPQLAEIESIVRKCVHCGLCTATCSSYVLLRDERDSPRGRIYLMKDMFEQGAKADRQITTHIDRCLTCLSCMTTCPGGVDYMHLVDTARTHIEKTGRRPLKQKLLRGMLAAILPNPRTFRLAVYGSLLAKPFRRLFGMIGLKEVEAMLALAPGLPARKGQHSTPGVIGAKTRPKKRVAIILGCAQQVLRARINDATIRVLTHHGVDVVIPDGIDCCGALVHHMGREEQAIATAKKNVDVLTQLMAEKPLDAVVINASGCGTTVKDYGHLLRNEHGHAARAKDISAMTKDISEFLAELGLSAPVQFSDLSVAYHSACSMQHGQRIKTEPTDLLQHVGYTITTFPEGHICCGSAGTYNILQPEIADELRERKIDNIMSVDPDVVATGNIGCITQLAPAMNIPVVHTIELIDWALGGDCPPELMHLKYRTRTSAAALQKTAAQ